MRNKRELHPLCDQIRKLRQAAGLSLVEAGTRSGIGSLTLGGYERGERIPPLHKVDKILAVYGYRLLAVPTEDANVHLPEDLGSALRLLADRFEKNGSHVGIEQAAIR